MPETAVDKRIARRRAATALAATALVRDVAQRLAEQAIPVMPVKGALLQHWLYDDPSERPLTDVDLLVRPDHLRRAVQVLEVEGYRRLSRNRVGPVVMCTPFGLALDLHPRLFDRARYRMSTYDVFSRSSEDREVYSASVRLPSPLDVYAHLIGKVGSDHLNARASRRLGEIARMSARLDVPPEAVAQHLMSCGMGRVARYVLPLVGEVTGDAFALEVHDRLPRDPVGGLIATATRPVFARVPPTSSVGALVAHLLNESLPRGIYSGIRALAQRLG